MAVKAKIKDLAPGVEFNTPTGRVMVLTHMIGGTSLIAPLEGPKHEGEPVTLGAAAVVSSLMDAFLEEDEVTLSDTAFLQGFTSRQLVEEVLRRIAAGMDVDEDEC